MHINEYGIGKGPPVLLLHGGGVAGWMWNPLRQVLEARHHVLVPDLPGHGASSNENYRSHAATIVELAAAVAPRTSGPVSVIGFSLGAQLAIGLAAHHPALVRRVMVVSAQVRPVPCSGLLLRLVGLSSPLARRRWFARLQSRQLFIPPALLEQYFRTSAAISKETLLAAVGENLRFTLPEEWSRFPGPALVMAGQQEREVMRASADAIHAALPGSALEMVAGCGHGIPLQHQDTFNARVAAWLSDQ